MKLFRSLVLASSLLGLGASAVVAAEAAASSQCCSTNCMMPCNWDMSMHRFYVGGGAAYSSNHKLDGWGGSGHVGYFFHKNHAVELELNYFGSKADQCTVRQIAVVSGTTTTSTQYNSSLKAKLEQWPLMLNYRYHGCLADFGCCDHDWMKRVLFNLGAGIGINFARTKSDISVDSFTLPAGTGAVTTTPNDVHKSHTEFAAQVFGQMGYAITDNFSVLTGLRAFFTHDFKFGDQFNNLDTGATSLVVDMGFNWRF